MICSVDFEFYSLQNHHAGVYNWSEEQQGWILSSFYIGYVLTHVPGGVIAEKYGGKWTLSLGILSTAVFTILTPFAVEYGTCALGIICKLYSRTFKSAHARTEYWDNHLKAAIFVKLVEITRILFSFFFQQSSLFYEFSQRKTFIGQFETGKIIGKKWMKIGIRCLHYCLDSADMIIFLKSN